MKARPENETRKRFLLGFTGQRVLARECSLGYAQMNARQGWCDYQTGDAVFLCGFCRANLLRLFSRPVTSSPHEFPQPRNFLRTVSPPNGTRIAGYAFVECCKQRMVH